MTLVLRMMLCLSPLMLNSAVNSSYYTKHQQEVCKDFHLRLDWQFHKQHCELHKSEHRHYLLGIDTCLRTQGASQQKVGEDKNLSAYLLIWSHLVEYCN